MGQQDEIYDVYTRSLLPGSKPELLPKSSVTKYPTDWVARWQVFYERRHPPGCDGGIEPGQAQSLFQTRPVPKSWNLCDVAPDGQRFLLNLPLEWTSASPITVIINWTENLKD